MIDPIKLLPLRCRHCGAIEYTLHTATRCFACDEPYEFRVFPAPGESAASAEPAAIVALGKPASFSSPGARPVADMRATDEALAKYYPPLEGEG